MQNQAIFNIGILGSVSNGKSSLVYKLTGIKTQKYASEIESNKTIKLGYANSKIYKCPICKPPTCYQPKSSDVTSAKCVLCNELMELQIHVSFVDCPGHHQYLATMLNGTSVMDAAIIIESIANNDIAQQTKEHINAINKMKINVITTCLNKIDTLIKPEYDINKNIILNKINDFKTYLEEHNITAPIIPISANLNINTDIVCEYICEYFKNNIIKKQNAITNMIIVRSFNINKQNVLIKDLVGGIVGGSIISGSLKIGDKIKILPGLIFDEENELGHIWTFQPILSEIKSINSEKNTLEYAESGGLIGIGLTIDPALTANDKLIGSVLLLENEETLYEIYNNIVINIKFINQVIIKKGDLLILNYNSSIVLAKVKRILNKDNKIRYDLNLKRPLCVNKKETITISIKINNILTVIGIGKIVRGIKLRLKDNIN